MKKIIPIAMISLALAVFSCNDGSKSKSWSKQQEKEWKTACVKMLEDGGAETPVAKDHCDCIFEKTSEKYTPQEAEKITEEQEKKLWEECDYSW